MNELDVTEEQVREERLGDIDRGAHWAYLVAVLVGSTILMLILMAILDALT
jgi:hypothetical protein